jgi:V8-like Glu-specific endopeptidase
MTTSPLSLVRSGLATGATSRLAFVASAALSLALGASACAADPLGYVEEPIVGGTRGGNPSVLWLYDTSAGGMCTASLIAPRVVLTAKHCVQHSGASGPTSASSLIVGTGDNVGHGATYRVLSVYTTPGTWTEGGRTGLSGALVGVDVAVLVLSSEVSGVEPLPLMRTSPRRLAGQSFTAVGFGQIPSGSAGTKYTVTGRVQSTDSSLIYVGAVTCQGDSGGPMITEAGEIAGVVSFGTGSCGSGYGAYNQIFPFFDMIDMALEEGGTCIASGAEVCDGRDNDCNDMVDETCTPRGEPCATDDECVGNQCRDTIAGRLCAASCDARNPLVGCEEGFYCAGLPGQCEGSCVPIATAMENRATGADCTDNLQCASLFCTDPGDGRRRCLQPCEADTAACLAGEVCANVLGACGACIDEALVAGSHNLGEPCVDGAGCSTGMCFTDEFPGRPARSYCTRTCTTDTDCGDRFHCRTSDTGGVCVSGPRSAQGDPCAGNDDCVDGTVCAARGEQRWCAGICGDGFEACRDGFTCVNVGAASVCVPDAGIAGDDCGVSEDCISGVCAVDATGGACTRTCGPDAPCPTGLECRRTADGITAVCVWPTAAPPPPPSGGCSVAGPEASRAGRADALALAGLTLLGVLIRRRRGGAK